MRSRNRESINIKCVVPTRFHRKYEKLLRTSDFELLTSYFSLLTSCISGTASFFLLHNFHYQCHKVYCIKARNFDVCSRKFEVGSRSGKRDKGSKRALPTFRTFLIDYLLSLVVRLFVEEKRYDMIAIFCDEVSKHDIQSLIPSYSTPVLNLGIVPVQVIHIYVQPVSILIFIQALVLVRCRKDAVKWFACGVLLIFVVCCACSICGQLIYMPRPRETKILPEIDVKALIINIMCLIQ